MIRFPTLHVATSVVNRILNAHKDLEKAQAASAAQPGAPSAPQSRELGATIDAGLTGPTAPVTQSDPTMAEDLTTQTLFE